MTRFEILQERYEKKSGSSKWNCVLPNWKLAHAIRGLDHKDYDSTFEGWANTDEY